MSSGTPAVESAICEVGSLLWQSGLVTGTEGNISVRTADNRVVCTPSGAFKGSLKPESLVTIDLDGNVIGQGKPSSEIKIHLEAYRRREDCKAVVHAHPPTAIGFSVAGEEIPDNVLPESAVVLGSVATVPFGMPGTQELADLLAPILPDHKTFILSHHGAMTLGTDVFDACYRMQCLEKVCGVLLTAKLLGTTRPMPTDAFSKFLETSLHGRLN